jgi:phospholipid/cholesterol/gamma-HCH transport system substrate-binding protein
METRARYVLIGLFALAVIAAGFGFAYWLENAAGLGERAHYRIRFEGSVSGLLLGSPVQFNGIRVGEVTGLDLDPGDPRSVIVTIAVTEATPIRADTAVGLAFGGLTGVPEVALIGGSPEATALEVNDGQPPLLTAGAGTGIDWTEAARQAFARVDMLLADNSEALKNTLSNLDTFSEALARNSESLDDIIAGLAQLAGARAGTRASVFYELPAAKEFPPVEQMPSGQLVVNQPSVPIALNTQRFVARAAGGDELIFEGAAWADSLPLTIQTALVRSFENAGYPRVGRDFQGLSADHVLSIDVESFHVVPGPTPSADIALRAKIVDSAGAIVAARDFGASRPLESMNAAAAANALGEAFREIAAGLTVWTLQDLASPR